MTLNSSFYVIKPSSPLKVFEVVVYVSPAAANTYGSGCDSSTS